MPKILEKIKNFFSSTIVCKIKKKEGSKQGKPKTEEKPEEQEQQSST